MSAAQPRRLTKAPVSLRAIIGRLNRKLGKKGWRLHKASKGLAYGPYFLVLHTSIERHGFDEAYIKQLARKEGALRDWEEMHG